MDRKTISLWFHDDAEAGFCAKNKKVISEGLKERGIVFQKDLLLAVLLSRLVTGSGDFLFYRRHNC
jgi:hypothetical protein